MKPNKINIRCTNCGVVLSLVNAPDLNEKSTTCPVCHTHLQIKDCKRVNKQMDEKTQYPDMESVRGNEEKTTVVGDSTANYTFGRLIVQPSGQSFQLRTGRYVIGRKHNEGVHADFEIATNCKRMSRMHLVIEVKKVEGKGFVHYASLYGQKANATFVGGNQLEVGDCIVLNDGDIIKLPDNPDICVKFEIPDEEKTDTDF